MRRRDFLKGLGLAAGAATVAPHTLPRLLEAIKPAPAFANNGALPAVYKARAFIPYSVELAEDFGSLKAEAQRLALDGLEDLTGERIAPSRLLVEHGTLRNMQGWKVSVVR